MVEDGNKGQTICPIMEAYRALFRLAHIASAIISIQGAESLAFIVQMLFIRLVAFVLHPSAPGAGMNSPCRTTQTARGRALEALGLLK